MHPFDVIKTRFQVKTKHGQYKSMADCCRTMYRTEGYVTVIFNFLTIKPSRSAILCAGAACGNVAALVRHLKYGPGLVLFKLYKYCTDVVVVRRRLCRADNCHCPMLCSCT